MTVIDEQALQKRYGGREEMITRLTNTFLRTHSDSAAKIRDAIARQDYDSLRDMAHSLKGLSGYLEASELFALSERAQVIAEQQSPDTFTICEDVAAALDRVVKALTQRLENNGT